MDSRCPAIKEFRKTTKMVKKNVVDVKDEPLGIVFGVQWEAPPGKGTVFSLKVSTRVGISRVEI